MPIPGVTDRCTNTSMPYISSQIGAEDKKVRKHQNLPESPGGPCNPGKPDDPLGPGLPGNPSKPLSPLLPFVPNPPGRPESPVMFTLFILSSNQYITAHSA